MLIPLSVPKSSANASKHGRDRADLEPLSSDPVRGGRGTGGGEGGGRLPCHAIPLVPPGHDQMQCFLPVSVAGTPPAGDVWPGHLTAASAQRLPCTCTGSHLSPSSLRPPLLTWKPLDSSLKMHFREQATPAAFGSLSKTRIPACTLLSFS